MLNQFCNVGDKISIKLISGSTTMPSGKVHRVNESGVILEINSTPPSYQFVPVSAIESAHLLERKNEKKD